ncbi:MAG: hypothetical protein ABW321_03110 [Polyangiales bacterium]
MSANEHLAPERALFVLALAPDDAERRTALAHADQCEACRRLLAESRSMLRLLDDERARAEREPYQLDALEARVLAALEASPLEAATTGPKLQAADAGSLRVTDGPIAPLKATVTAPSPRTAGSAPPRAAGAGSPLRAAWGGLGLALGAVLAAALVWLSVEPGNTTQVGFAVDDCMLLEQTLAAAAFGIGALAARAYATRLTAWQGALAAMSGALVGQALLLKVCGHPGALGHLLLSHVVGVVAATALGALLSAAWTRARAT